LLLLGELHKKSRAVELPTIVRTGHLLKFSMVIACSEDLIDSEIVAINDKNMIAVFLLNSLVVSIAVVIHYEFLFRITLLVPKMKIKHRFRIVMGVFGALIAHAVEIWVFALAYYFMHHEDDWGSLIGNFNGTLLDCFYFSSTTFTTLGFGDVEPSGRIRFLTGIESLTGLVLITWTASFLYFEMQRFWSSR